MPYRLRKICLWLEGDQSYADNMSDSRFDDLTLIHCQEVAWTRLVTPITLL